MKLKFLAVLIISAMFVGCDGGGGSSTSDVIKGADIKQKDVEKAFVNKTVYQANKQCDGTIDLGSASFTNETVTFTGKEGSDTGAFSINGNKILLQDETDTVTEIKKGEYVKLNDGSDEYTVYYSKENALANPKTHHCN